MHISQNIETELNFPPSSELVFPSELLSTGCSEQRPESPLPFSLPRSLPVCRPIRSSPGSRSSNPCNHRSHHRSHPHPLDSLQEGGRQKDVTHHKRSSYDSSSREPDFGVARFTSTSTSPIFCFGDFRSSFIVSSLSNVTKQKFFLWFLVLSKGISHSVTLPNWAK